MKNSQYIPIPSPKRDGRRIVIRNYRLSDESTGLSFRWQVYLTIWLSFSSIIFSYRFYSWRTLASSSTPPVALNGTGLTHGLNLNIPPHLSEPLTPINITKGTALVCACRNRHRQLADVLKSWMALPQVSQIIVVDWSSTPALYYAVEELDRNTKIEYPHVTILRVLDQKSWSISRAYNVAFRYASASRILSVPCGLPIHKSFLSKHVLIPGQFFTGSPSHERSRDEYAFHTVLYAFRSAVEAVGGYDERLISESNIREDHIDLVSRLSKRQLNRKEIDYDSLDSEFGKNLESNSVKTRYERDLTEVDADVNVRLVSALPKWNGTLSAESFFEDVLKRQITPSFRHRRVHYVSINLTMAHESVTNSISEEQLSTSRKAAVTDYMETVYRVPGCLTSILPLPERLKLLQTFGNLTNHGSNKPRALFVITQGELMERLMMLASSRSYAAHTGRALFVLWPRISEVPDRFTSISALFHSLPHSISLVENVDEIMIAQKGCPKFGLVNNNTSAYSFSRVQHEPTSSIPAIAENTQHIIVRGTSFIKSEVLRFSNIKTIRAELRDILSTPLNEDIAIKIRSVNPEELGRAVGIHLPSTMPNHSTKLEYFSAVHKALAISNSSFSKPYNTSTPVYINSDWRFVQRFKHLGLRMLPTLRGPSECEQLGQDKCFFSQMLQIKALTTTARFISTTNDSFSYFISMYRNDET